MIRQVSWGEVSAEIAPLRPRPSGSPTAPETRPRELLARAPIPVERVQVAIALPQVRLEANPG